MLNMYNGCFIKKVLYYLSMYLSKRMFTRTVHIPYVLRMADLRHAYVIAI